MSTTDDLQTIQNRRALDDWLADQKRRMKLRFPLIDFESDHWPIRTLYRTEQRDWYFTQPFSDFSGKDVSYCDVLRCLVAEMILAGQPKAIDVSVVSYRLLARASAYSLFALTLKDLRQLEADCINDARTNPASAKTYSVALSNLVNRYLAQLASKNVIPRLGFRVRAEVKAELYRIYQTHIRKQRSSQSDILDRKMEAFNQAFNALIENPLDCDGNPLLSDMDRVAICMVVVLMCAPSRINEPLCMSIDDHITINDYAAATVGKSSRLHDAHKLLLMKGSKGAQWTAKPVLDFMIDALDYCINIVRDHGMRSRMLVEWYQQNPSTLYLPPELEYLRGQLVSRKRLGQIIHLNSNSASDKNKGSIAKYFRALKGRAFRGPNPEKVSRTGRTNTRSSVELLEWADVEKFLLSKVHDAMAVCRKVTNQNHYQGDLSKMLFLFDGDRVAFQPQAVTYKNIKQRFKQSKCERKQLLPPTLFERLKITMPVAGKIQIGEIDTHDPRHWLTTQALSHSDNLSNVLINKWANRLSLTQIKNYDKRYPEFKATQAAMPETPELIELTDLSNGLNTVRQLEDDFGLSTAIVTAHDAGIAMTSMEAVIHATEDRPVAKSSRGIIIIYPQRFGVCLHQHHEKPCRNYSNDLAASCITCDEGVFVKGHLPTNDEMRKMADQLYTSILRHLEHLSLTHNRFIADDPETLGEHMLTLVKNGLDCVTMAQLATHLIDNFDQVNSLLKDRLLASRLHQAFVAREVVNRLDDQTVSNGALIKYHNPTQHSEPLLELALDAHGGREQVALDEQALIAKYPQFGPKALGLTDQRHLIAPDSYQEED